MGHPRPQRHHLLTDALVLLTALVLAAGPAAAVWTGDDNAPGQWIYADHPVEGAPFDDPLSYTLADLDADGPPFGRAVRDLGAHIAYSDDETRCVHALFERLESGNHSGLLVDGTPLVVGMIMTLYDGGSGGNGAPPTPGGDDGSPATPDDDDIDEDADDTAGGKSRIRRAAEAPGLVGGILFGIAMLALVAVRKL